MRELPSGVLLYGQLAAVLAYPFFDDSQLGKALLGVFGTALVLAALAVVRMTPALSWVAIFLGVPAVTCNLLEAIFPDSTDIVLVSALFHAPFYFYVAFGLIRYLFTDTHVSRDELYATGAAFTVVAWGFAYLYVAVQILQPGSFTSGGGTSAQSWFELLFLSFTTLTSTGLSDIYAVLPHARSVLMLEQVAGVLYLALVVTRLVGLTANRPPRL